MVSKYRSRSATCTFINRNEAYVGGRIHQFSMHFKEILQTSRIVFLSPWNKRRSLFGLLRIFHELDRHSELFQGQSKIRCKAGCGKCCETPHIETTVFEMMPAAYEFLRTNKTISSLERERSKEGDCIFYKRDLKQGQGRCTIYPFRPLICRLFGFAATKDKSGQEQLVSCSIIKSSLLASRQKLNLKIAPFVQEYMMRVYSLEPTLGKDQLPIKEAFKQALERVMLIRNYSELGSMRKSETSQPRRGNL